ncbi:MAG: sigma-70 family RNA polymerase sigma factor [Planctomycetes bacterium]|nr:sigma-70 family RNA polymerase sigma factor [Planctomycetota bacterium]
MRSKKIKCDARSVLEAAYDRYGCELYQYALMILANQEAAEDVVQQIFGQLLAMGKRVLEIEKLDRYLRRAVRNECYKVLKKRQKADLAVGELYEGALLANNDSEGRGTEERLMIEEILRPLPAEQREVVHLKVYEGRSFREIGEMMEISINTASSRYRYAMDKLREIFKRDDEAQEVCHE